MKNSTWSIGRKLALGFGAIIILTLTVGAVGLFALNRVKTVVNSTTTVSARLETLSNLIEISLLEARRNEKDFFLRYKEQGIEEAKAEYVANVQANVLAIHEYAAEGERLVVNEVDRTRFNQIEELIDNYEADYLHAVALVEERGFVDTGLEGQFRAKVHEMETVVDAAGSDQLLIDVLMIRRHEKDYLLRSEQTYIDQVREAVVQLKQGLATTSLNNNEQARLSTLADEYLVLFLQLTELEAELAAAIERYREDAHTIEPLAAEIRVAAADNFHTSVAETNQSISTANNLEVSTLILAVLLGFGIAFFLARNLSKPIRRLTEVATAIAQGNLSHEIQVSRRDEIGSLATAFNQMIDYQQEMAGVANRLAQGDLTGTITPKGPQDILGNTFQQMITNLRLLISQALEATVAVDNASGQLAVVAQQAGQASQQVAATVQQIAQGATQQTLASTEVTHNIEQMARAAEGIADGAQEQAQEIQKTSQLVNEMDIIADQVNQITEVVSQATIKVTQVARQGVTTVQQTGQGMETIRSRALSAAEKVKEMSLRSREIGRIAETIEDIADKTDMLALNAAVEAARAGEYGRGFAVVADQVRRLSEDSKVATRDISVLIERVQESVREAITAMDGTVTEVGNGTRLTQETSHSLGEILQVAEEAASQAGRISSAAAQLRQKSEGLVAAVGVVSVVIEENTSVAEEMAAGSQQVTEAMTSVVSVAEENSASAEEVSASAEEMSAQVEEVVASSEELAQLAEQLKQAVAQFNLGENGRGYFSPAGRGRGLTYPPARYQPHDSRLTELESNGHSYKSMRELS
jgi:methyl-accepting chemotaxis protein